MTEEPDIPLLFQEIINDFVIAPNSGVITGIVVVGSTSTITAENISNLSDGMMVTIDNNTYSISNKTSTTFDIAATGLTATDWKITLNYIPGHKEEVNETINSADRKPTQKAVQYPLIWLMTDNPLSDSDSHLFDYTTPMRWAIAYKSELEYSTLQSISDVIKPVLNPLYALVWTGFEASGYFFRPQKKRTPRTSYKRRNYGSVGLNNKTGNKAQMLPTVTDAVEFEFDLELVVKNTNTCIN